MINLDFADVKTVMESGGMAHMGIGMSMAVGFADDYIKAVKKRH